MVLLLLNSFIGKCLIWVGYWVVSWKNLMLFYSISSMDIRGDRGRGRGD